MRSKSRLKPVLMIILQYYSYYCIAKTISNYTGVDYKLVMA